MEINDSRVLFAGSNSPKIECPPIIIADAFRTPENIGNLVRLAANVGAETLICLDSAELKQSKMRKTACMAWDYVNVVHAAEAQLSSLLPDDYTLVAVETSAQSQCIYSVALPRRIAFVLGSEIHGVRTSILDACQLHVHIPMTGPATSMNVSHAAAVALFEWQRQAQFSPEAKF